MKKLTSGVLSATIGLLAVGFIGTPAQASESKKEVICHATAADKYVSTPVARDSIINGGHGENGINAGDIIQPFSYNFNGGPEEQYPGQNWVGFPENQTLFNNGCNPTDIPLTPVLPVAPIATCSDQNPTLTIPAQPSGINVTSTANDKGEFFVNFQLPEDTPYTTYSFADGFSKDLKLTTIDNRPTDPLWDDATKTCKMPDTGAGDQIQWWMIPTAAGMFLLAALLFVAKPFIGRRFSA